MDLRSELPYWTLKNGLIAPFPPLAEDVSCEVLVVGGGITGALVAYHLAQEGIDTVLIDKREIGFGSTSASTGLLLWENDVDLRRMVDLVGEEAAGQAWRACKDAVSKIGEITKRIKGDASFEAKKSVYVASTKADAAKLEDELTARRRLGFRPSLLDPRDVRKLGIEAEGALVSVGSAQIDPYRFCHQLLRFSAERGLRVFDRTEMKRYKSRTRSVSATTDQGHSISAKRIVLATGYEAQWALTRKIVKLTSTFAFVSEPLEDIAPFDKHIFWETARPYLYARSTSDQRLIVGGGDEDFVDAERRDEMMPAKTRFLVQRLRKFLPNLDVEPAFSWAGTFGSTKDGLPYIGTVKQFPNSYFALGYGGNGMTFSVIAAGIIRDLYLRRPNPAANYYRFDR